MSADRPPYRQPAALLWVLCGGIIGTGLRYGMEELWPATSGQWPWATFGVNLVGAFVLGALLEGLALAGADEGWRRRARLLVGTGLCGSFTTYSSFALETTMLAHDHAPVLGLVYAVVSVIGGLVAAWLGIGLAGRALRRVGAVS